MTIRKIAGRVLPPPPRPPGPLEQATLLLRVKLLPFWLFWQNLRELRPWWPLLLPLLLWYGRRVYRRERAVVLAARRAPAALEALRPRR
ncbi:MAG TPA: hypothetical protein VNL77_04190 [Roseiflexaceae bacterium]|nr:hypothetical protein [Roseiflexaceae bacterium]